MPDSSGVPQEIVHHFNKQRKINKQLLKATKMTMMLGYSNMVRTALCSRSCSTLQADVDRVRLDLAANGASVEAVESAISLQRVRFAELKEETTRLESTFSARLEQHGRELRKFSLVK